MFVPYERNMVKIKKLENNYRNLYTLNSLYYGDRTDNCSVFKIHNSEIIEYGGKEVHINTLTKYYKKNVDTFIFTSNYIFRVVGKNIYCNNLTKENSNLVDKSFLNKSCYLHYIVRLPKASR